MKRKKWLFLIPLGFVVFVGIGGAVVMLLWNWLVPAIIGWKLISFWQAVGLLALCRILFGGHGGAFRRFKDRRRKMRERWEKMTPEEREKLRQGMRGRCGPFREPPSEGAQQA